ncbi:MAG: HD domain-containing protein [Candidatus Komeilibacteria bacterium]|nr:HD domain-containing protein [Candidatus Komeilibacteria bacterium]
MNDKDLQLMFEIGCLRFINRGWQRYINPDFANLAEHTLRVCWLALLIAEKEGADTGKIVKMALAHDLAESRGVDVDYLSRQFVTRHEDKAIAESLSDTGLENLLELFEEYEKRESLEAKIVKDADILDVDLELKEQASKGNNLNELWHDQRARNYEFLHTDSARELWKKIQNANPHDWHLKGSNRLNAGDWKK